MSKVQLAGNANGTGIFTIASPNSNTDRTLTLPDQTGTLLSSSAQGIPRTALPAGSVLQVVNTTSSTNISTTGSSDVDTLLTASITPTTSTSRILVIISPFFRATTASSTFNCFAYLKLWRGAIGSGTLLVNGYPIVGANNTDFRGVGNVTYYDNPATTSSVTYRVSMNSAFAATVEINSTTNPSSITLLEIAA